MTRNPASESYPAAQKHMIKALYVIKYTTRCDKGANLINAIHVPGAIKQAVAAFPPEK